MATIGAADATAVKRGHAHPGKPVHRSLPRISGSPALGKILHASHGRWVGAAKFSYKWERCNAHGKKCKLIRRPPSKQGTPRLAASAYKLTSADLGHKIRVIVIATNRHGKASATSRATAVIRRHAPTTTPAPPTGTSPGSGGSGGTTAPGLHVVGNQLESASGQTVVLHGVLRNGPEYACAQGFGLTDGPSGDSEFSPMPSWKINSVFIGLSADCWLGINGVKAQYAGQNYINFVKSEVASEEKYGLYPVIGLFVSDPGTDAPNYNDSAGGQPPMPDNDHVPLFWEEMADTFKNDPNVIFRLQEEPHPDNNGTSLAAWQCWSQGDVQYGTSSANTPPTPPTSSGNVRHCNESDSAGTAYQTVGMQSLINIIRSTGAKNVIQVPGLEFANMLSCGNTQSPTACGFLDSTDGVRVSDSLSPAQLGADVDLYPDVGQDCDNVTCYQDTFGPVAAVMPLDAGETGGINSGNPFPQEEAFLNWLDSKGQSYYAAAWDTWSDLISDYNGTPKSPWGTYYQSHIGG